MNFRRIENLIQLRVLPLQVRVTFIVMITTLPLSNDSVISFPTFINLVNGPTGIAVKDIAVIVGGVWFDPRALQIEHRVVIGSPPL